jgi:hypothetical protein
MGVKINGLEERFSAMSVFCLAEDILAFPMLLRAVSIGTKGLCAGSRLRERFDAASERPEDVVQNSCDSLAWMVTLCQ